ncbi:MAG: efflux RND transporter periplasmic adaptor subunit [Smithella sp.]
MEEYKHRIMIISCFLAAAMLFFAVVTTGCKGKERGKTAGRPEITGVTVSPVALSTVDDIYETTGTIKANTTSVVASRMMGVVTSVSVKEGDAVKAGQVLLVIDDRDAAQRVRASGMSVESARQNKDLAEKTWQRYKNLYNENALSRQEMDQVETQKKVADAEYERIKAMDDESKTYMSFTRITAPINGRVTEKRIDVGSMATPGMPLLVLEGGGSSYIEASIDAGLGTKIKKGMPVEVEVETLDRPLGGKIRDVFPSVDPLSRTFIVKVAIGNTGIRNGLFARLRIPVGKRNAIVVPEKAIVQKGQLIGVYALDSQGIVTYRLIRKGNSFSGGTEILSGLRVNDKIIIDGVEHVVDGGVIEGEKVK